MSKVIYCEVIIRDDFNNVLIVQRKVKKDEKPLWSIIGKPMRAKESEEKCVSRIMKDDLRTIGFDIQKVEEYMIDGDNSKAVYVAILREGAVTHSDIIKKDWITKNDLDKYEFESNHKEILEKFWNNK